MEKRELTQELINEFKQKYPAGIYKTVIGDQIFIWRPLLRSEYVKLASDDKLDLLEKEELITSMCVLWPEMTLEEVKQLDAGIPTSIAESIMQKSGFEVASVEKL